MHWKSTPHPTSRLDAGFTLVEMILATMLSLVVLSATYTALIQFRKVYFDQNQKTEVLDSLRTAHDFLSRDMTGAGYHLINRSRLGFFGTVFPNTDTLDPATTTSITIWSNPGTAEASLTDVMAATSSALPVDGTSGFTAGMVVWVIGSCTDGVVRRDRFTVSSVDSTPPYVIYHAAPPNASANFSCKYRTGARVVRLKQVTYQLSAPVAGLSDLMRTEDEDPPVAIASGLTTMTFSYWNGLDPPTALTPNTAALRRSIRRIGVTLVGRSAEKMRITRQLQTQTVTGDLSPRNLILQDNL